MILETGRSPGEGNGYTLPHFCLENSIDRGTSPSELYGRAHGTKVNLGWTHTSLALKPDCHLPAVWLGHVLTLSESVFLNLENVLAADAHILKDYSDLVVRSSGKFASTF